MVTQLKNASNGRHTVIALIAAATCAAAAPASATDAPDPNIQWRLLGPAWSHHFGSSGARISVERSPQVLCVAVPNTDPTNTSAPVLQCTTTQRISAVTPRWQSNNPAFGGKRIRHFDDHDEAMIASYITDSYGSESFLAAYAASWVLAEKFGVTLSAGAGAGLWWRTVLSNGDPTNIHRKFVPFVLPMISVADRNTGLGVELAFAPKVRLAGYSSATPTLMIQLSYAIN